MGGWFDSEIVANDRLALFLCLVAFIVTFVTTRAITRMIRAGKGPFKDNVSRSGVHVHHAVPGIILLVTGAVMSVATGSEVPWAEIAAVLVGIGTSLVLDEFALILHMSDVYWSQEGRLSVEMVSLAVACMGLVLVGFSPISFSGEAGDNAIIATVFGVGSFHIACIVTCILKGKYQFALLGAFIPMLAVFCAVRIARPDSQWAHRFYDEARMARATARATAFDRRFGRIADFVGDFVAGKPDVAEPSDAPAQA
ncbi:MAG TPA: hypothetical protein VFT09_10220 [Ilumatobacteraceae bacterium]|nr:hypothetical protein [Ilumatobacteraceae bacterium]